jgi:Secretory protein of YscJ/FliF family
MRTIDRLSSTPAVSWLRREAGRLRRAMMAQHPAVRLGLVLAPMILVAAAGYWAAGTLAPAGPRYLAGGRAFSSDDLITIFRALDAKGIAYRPDDRRIEVAADQSDQATAVLAKLNVGQESVKEIRERSLSLSKIFEMPDREQEERLRREKLIERFINGLDGVVWSVVCIQHPRAAFPRMTRIKPSAFVYLESESDRPLPPEAIQAIPMILTSNEPELSAEAITVMDRKGHPYLDPSNPMLGKRTRDLMREQELRDKVADRLSWIKGVRIWVELGDGGETAQDSAAKAQHAAADRTAGDRGEHSPSIAVNQPADLGEPVPPPEPARVEKPERGRMLVYVPRSYYYSRMLPHPDHREPTSDELQQVAARIRGDVEKLVRPLIPASWTLDVGQIPDDLPTTRSAALPAGSDRRYLAADWGVIGAVAGAVALLLAMGSWIQSARRPVQMVASPSVGRRYREDPADEPEPSERVRELVRRDPEVAASVLQRWATQGGPAS